MEKLNLDAKQVETAILSQLTREKKFTISFDGELTGATAEEKKSAKGYYEPAKAIINFEGSKLADVLDDAISKLVIKIQSRLRDTAPTAEALHEYIQSNDGVFEFNYAELQGRQQLSTVEQAQRAAAKLSPEEKKALLAMLQAEAE